ncbi:MAG: hypothetical protein ACREX8_20540, partial [Gammaproteobacteria bacterium]
QIELDALTALTAARRCAPALSSAEQTMLAGWPSWAGGAHDRLDAKFAALRGWLDPIVPPTGRRVHRTSDHLHGVPGHPAMALRAAARRGLPGGAAGVALRRAGRATEEQVDKWLAACPSPHQQAVLHAACDNDAALAQRMLPFWGLLRTDLRGLPTVFPAGSVLFTQVGDRLSTGTHYTPAGTGRGGGGAHTGPVVLRARWSSRRSRRNGRRTMILDVVISGGASLGRRWNCTRPSPSLTGCS